MDAVIKAVWHFSAIRTSACCMHAGVTFLHIGCLAMGGVVELIISDDLYGPGRLYNL